MIAELNRIIGNFEKCLEIIDSIETPDFNWLKEAFRESVIIKIRMYFRFFNYQSQLICNHDINYKDF